MNNMTTRELRSLVPDIYIEMFLENKNNETECISGIVVEVGPLIQCMDENIYRNIRVKQDGTEFDGMVIDQIIHSNTFHTRMCPRI